MLFSFAENFSKTVENSRKLCYTVGKQRSVGMKKMIWKYIWCAVVLAALAVGFWFLYDSGFFQSVSSVERAQEYISGFAPYTHIAFFVIQLLSVIFAPIPSNITALAGGALLGTWSSFFLTLSAVVIGSITVFCLARVLGGRFTDRVVSRKDSEKYLKLINAKRDSFLVLAFLFPFFPDDIICILAGLTRISLKRFFIIVLLTRPWGLLFASALGGAAIDIPWWGMAILGIAGFALFLLGMKYGERIQDWLTQRLGKTEKDT